MMTGGELASVIAGTREDWPGGPRTLTPREPTREPNGTLWFGGRVELLLHARGLRGRADPARLERAAAEEDKAEGTAARRRQHGRHRQGEQVKLYVDTSALF